jgi:hypothetical protein
MDTNSAQIWQQLFFRLAPQFSDLMREEERTEITFDILSFYVTALKDYALLETLQPSIEPILTLAKEKCKVSCTKFLQKVADVGPKFRDFAAALIPL